MWTRIDGNVYIQGQFLLFFQQAGVGTATWVVAKITKTGITKSWLPEEIILEENRCAALQWGDTIVHRHATVLQQRDVAGRIRWLPNQMKVV